MKRVRVVPKRPNLLFEKWLEEWRIEAVQKNSGLQNYFSNALKSLKKYPLPLKSGKDCIILRHFGTKLCLLLDRKLEKHKTICAKSSYTSVDNIALTDIVENHDIQDRVCSTPILKNRELISTKCGESLEETCTEKISRKTVKTVVNAGQKRQIKGGSKIVKKTVLRETVDAILPLDVPPQTNVCLKPDTFDVILLVDKQEISGSKTELHNDNTIRELTRHNVRFEVRHLKVGDFTWIAKCRRTNVELVLPYVIERKRIDDLSASIRDGRFHEQKFRLRKCGIENVTYLIESCGSRFCIPLSSLMQASINSLVHDGFIIKYTNSHKHSMSYLVLMTEILWNSYKSEILTEYREGTPISPFSNRPLRFMRFETFNEGASKQKIFTVRQMFVRHLLQLKGLSIDKVLAVVKDYWTPRILINTLRRSKFDAEQIVKNIRVGSKNRQLGLTITKAIINLYMKENLH